MASLFKPTHMVVLTAIAVGFACGQNVRNKGNIGYNYPVPENPFIYGPPPNKPPTDRTPISRMDVAMDRVDEEPFKPSDMDNIVDPELGIPLLFPTGQDDYIDYNYDDADYTTELDEDYEYGSNNQDAPDPFKKPMPMKRPEQVQDSIFEVPEVALPFDPPPSMTNTNGFPSVAKPEVAPQTVPEMKPMTMNPHMEAMMMKDPMQPPVQDQRPVEGQVMPEDKKMMMVVSKVEEDQEDNASNEIGVGVDGVSEGQGQGQIQGQGLDFSKATRNADGNLCVFKEEMVQTVIKEPTLKCIHREVEKCHYTYVTRFVSTQEEICDESFQKRCQITFVKRASKETVKKCYTPLNKTCDGSGPEICRTLFESSCTTRYIEKSKGNFVGNTNCEKLPIKICGKGCVTKPGKEECHNKEIDVIIDIPEEICDLNPQKVCRMGTRLVPRLTPKHECTKVPRQVCNLQYGPPKIVMKPFKSEWCLDESELPIEDPNQTQAIADDEVGDQDQVQAEREGRKRKQQRGRRRRQRRRRQRKQRRRNERKRI